MQQILAGMVGSAAAPAAPAPAPVAPAPVVAPAAPAPENRMDSLIQKILSDMVGRSPAAVPVATANPAKARVAMQTPFGNYEVKEHTLPEVGDGDILVKVEGCGIGREDANGEKKNPFCMIPAALGSEGTGEIVKMGRNVKKDSLGKALNIGDKVVTCMPYEDEVCGQDSNSTQMIFSSWLADYILIREGSVVFNVTDLDLNSRILVAACAEVVHAVERAKIANILRFNSSVVIQGCDPIGLICIAVLRTMGIQNICAVDNEERRLEFAKRMGATQTVNFNECAGVSALVNSVTAALGGRLADFAFQCTGSPVAHANIYKVVRKGGGICELGITANRGDAVINPHFDICAKEIIVIGSCGYTANDYEMAIDFLKRAKGIGFPVDDLITDTYTLNQINEANQKRLASAGLKIAVINK